VSKGELQEAADRLKAAYAAQDAAENALERAKAAYDRAVLRLDFANDEAIAANDHFTEVTYRVLVDGQ